MPRPRPQQHALARRARPRPGDRKPRRWLHQGAAAVGVSVLGLGLAASVSLTNPTEHHYAVEPVAPQAQLAPLVERAAGVQVPSAFARRDESVSRPGVRASLPTQALDQLADQRADSLTALQSRVQLVARAKAVEVRAETLTSASRSATLKAARIEAARLRAQRARQAAERRAAERKAAAREAARRAANDQDTADKKAADDEVADNRAAQRTSASKDRASSTPAPRRAAGRASLPITSGYHLAARFGDTGAWSRHHTGLDFSAPMGTTVRAMAAGEVTHAGSGGPGWAGNYVTIRHADGKTTLYAHLSTVSVDEGERVGGGDRIGAVGMTGRTFGPHVHVELYPRGVRPGDVYRAINPSPWLRARGVRP